MLPCNCKTYLYPWCWCCFIVDHIALFCLWFLFYGLKTASKYRKLCVWYYYVIPRPTLNFCVDSSPVVDLARPKFFKKRPNVLDWTFICFIYLCSLSPAYMQMKLHKNYRHCSFWRACLAVSFQLSWSKFSLFAQPKRPFGFSTWAISCFKELE